MATEILNGDVEKMKAKMHSSSPMLNTYIETARVYKNLRDTGHKTEWTVSNIDIICFGFKKDKRLIKVETADILVFLVDTTVVIDNTVKTVRDTYLMIKEDEEWKFYSTLLNFEIEKK